MPENKNNNGLRRNWPIAVYIASIIFATGGAWALLFGQARCNERQEERIGVLETSEARMDERLKAIDEKLRDIKAILERRQ